jgi:hypothetical protein
MATVKLGLIVSPTIDQLAADELATELGAALSEHYPEVEWELDVLTDPLAEPPAHLTELVSAARRLLLDADWDLAVAITELPLRLAHRTLLSHASRTHGVALVSLPAVGVLRRRRRLYDVVAGAVGALVGDREHGHAAQSAVGRLGVERRLAELAGDVDDDDDGGAAYVARVISGNLRLLVGMVGANHPWRLVGTLWRAILAAIAAVAFGLIGVEVWRIAASLGPLRLAIAALLSIAAGAVTLVAGHHLWERAPDPRVREQVTLFNLATTATVVLGITALYLFVFVASLLGALLLIEPSLLSDVLDRDVDGWDYVRIALLVSTLGTVGGALGATAETDEAVREAAYAVDRRRGRPTHDGGDGSSDGHPQQLRDDQPVRQRGGAGVPLAAGRGDRSGGGAGPPGGGAVAGTDGDGAGRGGRAGGGADAGAPPGASADDHARDREADPP